MKDNIILSKSFDFAIRIVELYKYLVNEHKEYVLSKQVLRSGTSIGANVNEAVEAQSKKDFVSKMSIALKETSETIYWLKLLYSTKYIAQSQYNALFSEVYQLKKILTSIIISAKEKMSANDEK